MLFKKENESMHIESTVPDYVVQEDKDCKGKRQKAIGAENIQHSYLKNILEFIAEILYPHLRLSH